MKLEIKERPFEKWVINTHRAKSPDGKYSFWIASGFMFFHDNHCHEQLLSLVGCRTRYKIWKELKKEMILRIDEVLQAKEMIK
jgi:hypothetical protein